MQAMKERDDKQPLEGFIQLDDAYWAACAEALKVGKQKGNAPL